MNIIKSKMIMAGHAARMGELINICSFKRDRLKGDDNIKIVWNKESLMGFEMRL
jgi:hypothetical protein